MIKVPFHIHSTQHNRRYLSRHRGHTSQSTVSDGTMQVSACNISLQVLFSRTEKSCTCRSLRICPFLYLCRLSRSSSNHVRSCSCSALHSAQPKSWSLSISFRCAIASSSVIELLFIQINPNTVFQSIYILPRS